MKKIKQVLFVCMGNTARSPAAEYLARYYSEKLHGDLTFDSCGFFNAFNFIQPESSRYLDSKGINHYDFIPKIVNQNLLEKQDLILTMERKHSREIIRNFSNIPNIEGKTFTLKEFNGEKNNVDIIDPYYTTNDMYRQVLKIIDENVEKAIKKIIKNNKC